MRFRRIYRVQDWHPATKIAAATAVVAAGTLAGLTSSGVVGACAAVDAANACPTPITVAAPTAPVTTTVPPPVGTANAWLNPSGAGANPAVCHPSCSYDSTKAFATMQAAQTAMSGGDTAIMRCGAFPAQTITTGTKSSVTNFVAETFDQATTPYTVIPATTCATVAKLTITGVDKIHITGIQATTCPDASRTDAVLTYTLCDASINITNAISDITVDGWHGSNAQINSSNVTFNHSSFGNFDACYDFTGTHISNNSIRQDAFRFWTGTSGSTNPAMPLNDTIRNSIVHDVLMGVNDAEVSTVCGLGSTNGPHSDCMQNNGGSWLIDSVIFKNCSSNNLQDNPFAGSAVGTQTVQNSYLGPTNGITNNSVMGVGSGQTADCSNVVVRNSILRKSINVPGTCAPQMQAYGNWIVSGTGAGSQVNYHHNAYGASPSGTNSITCTPTWLNALPSTEDLLGPVPDVHIDPSDTCLKNADTLATFPSTDIDGDARPGGDGLVSLGPDEVEAGTSGDSLATCSPACGNGTTPTSTVNNVNLGTYNDGTANFNGHFGWYLPTNIHGTPPVIFIASGAGGSGSSHIASSFSTANWQSVANANALMIVVLEFGGGPTAAPACTATGGAGTCKQSWDSSEQDFPAASSASDTALFISAKNYVCSHTFGGITPDCTRLYAQGGSSGGHFMRALMCNSTTVAMLRGISIVAAGADTSNGGSALSCLNTSNKNIFIHYIAGNVSSQDPFNTATLSGHDILGYQASKAAMVSYLGCGSPTTVVSGSKTTDTYNCAQSFALSPQFRTTLVAGASHSWPGIDSVLGASGAANDAWSFFASTRD